MKRCFIVTSSINVDPSKLLKNTFIRSYFSPEERLRQTVATVINLNVADPEADIFLIDSSKDRFDIFEQEHVFQNGAISGLPRVKYVRLQDLNSEVAEMTRSHFSQTHCECLMLLEFLKHYKQELQSYDFITKISGRYLIDSSFNTEQFIPEHSNKFIFKKALTYEADKLFPAFRAVLADELIIDNRFSGYHTCLLSWGIEKLDVMELIFKLMVTDTKSEQSKHWAIDMEHFLYYYLNRFLLLPDVIEVDWRVYGWGGKSGGFVVV